MSLNGKLVSRGPVESFPFRLPMPLRSRASLIRTGVRLRLAVREYAKIAAPREGEEPAVRQQRMLEFMDDRSFAQFSGALPEDVDLLFRSTLTRSSGEPEELAAGYGVGYFHLVWDRKGGLSRNILGGSGVVIDALAATLGDRVRLGARVTSVVRTADGVRVEIDGGRAPSTRGRRSLRPPRMRPARSSRPSRDTAAALAAIPYGPYVVGAFLTKEHGVGALGRPLRACDAEALVQHALQHDERAPRGGDDPRAGGSFMVYAAADFARRLDGLDDDAVRERFLADLHDVLPATRSLVEEVVIKRWEHGLP